MISMSTEIEIVVEQLYSCWFRFSALCSNEIRENDIQTHTKKNKTHQHTDTISLMIQSK